MNDNQTGNQTQGNNPSNPSQPTGSPFLGGAGQPIGSPFSGAPTGAGQPNGTPLQGVPPAPGQPLSPGARQLNDLLNRFARPFLAKCLTRLITWGATAICGYLALSAPDPTWTTQAAATAAGAVCLITATTIDRWHHKADMNR